MDLLLDTHTFIWWDDGKLPTGVVKRIQAATTVFVSSASAWEMAIKSALGKLTVRTPLQQIIDDNQFTALPIAVAHAAATRALPLLHRDPFDRMLVAQARIEGLTIVSKDKLLRKYKVPVVWD